MPTCREDSSSSRRADNDKLLALCLDIPVGLARTLSARTVFVLLTGLAEVECRRNEGEDESDGPDGGSGAVGTVADDRGK